MDFTECYGDTVSSVAAAARSGCRTRVRRLIKRGCSVDCRDNRGWNALHEAAAAGSTDCVQEILSAASGKKCSNIQPINMSCSYAYFLLAKGDSVVQDPGLLPSESTF